jgi:hypothetical protein
VYAPIANKVEGFNGLAAVSDDIAGTDDALGRYAEIRGASLHRGGCREIAVGTAKDQHGLLDSSQIFHLTVAS